MKKYTKPELDCNEIAMANIMQSSTDPSTNPQIQVGGGNASNSVPVDAKHAIPSQGNKFDF